MSHCNQCGKDVGCGCNLITGSCASCYNKGLSSGEDTPLAKKSTKRVIYKNITPTDAPPNTEFEVILKSQGISKEEKLRRINDILEKARQQMYDNN